MTKKRLRNEIDAFLDRHPHGWSDAEWRDLLDRLAAKKIDVSDPDGLGLELERTRLVRTLDAADIKGLGPKRTEAIADKYGTVWNLRQAESDDLARIPAIPRRLADTVKEHFPREG